VPRRRRLTISSDIDEPAEPSRPAPTALHDALAIVAHEVHHDLSDLGEAAASIEDIAARLEHPELSDRCRQLVSALGRLDRALERFLQEPEEFDRLRLSPVRVAGVVREVVQSHAPAGHQVVTDVASVVAELDALKFERIVDNLLVNALQHTPVGSKVRVSVAAVPGGWLRLEVTDDGPGLSAEQRGRAFDEADGRATRGFAVVARFVRLHGGHVSARPGPSGTGLSVEVELPAGRRDRRWSGP
jgi:signal transduction histidine kinase